ncbi:hypothetical protein Tco_0719583 [Tanacetum coccineum]
MDCAINDLESEFMSMSTILEEIRSAIGGGGGSHSNRESDNHDDSMSLQEEEDDGYEVFTGEPKGRFNGPRVMNRRMKGRHGYKDRQRYRVKAKIPNFLENLDPEAVLDWLYEVNKFFDIMDVLKEEQVKILAYKLCGGSEAWKKTVVEYTREFLRLQVRCNLKESLEQTASSNRKVGIVVVLSSIDAAIEVMYQSKSVEDNYGLSSYVVGGLVYGSSKAGDVSREGYLEVVVRNSMDNAYYTPFTLMFLELTHFVVLTIEETVFAISMA